MKNMQWKCGLLVFTVIGLMGMMNKKASAQNKDPDPQVVVETTVVPTTTDNCAEGKPRTEIEVDALTGVVHTIKNVDTACIEIVNNVYKNKGDAPPVSPAVTIDPFSTAVETSKYDFGGGFFVSGLLLPQRSSGDLHSSANESLEEMFTAGLVGTLNTPSWEWSANIGAGGCGKREVAGTAGVALLSKMSSENFRLGGTVNVDVCSNVTDPGEELVQLRTFDAGLRLAGSWQNFGVYVDFVGAVSTKPLFIGRSTEFGAGVRAGVIVGKF